MSRNPPINPAPRGCHHTSITCESSPHALDAGYQRPTARKRQAATTPTGRSVNGTENPDTQFPAPLVLPGDDLATDPNAPPQSLLSWLREKDRNEVTPSRRTIYIAAPPNIGPRMSFMKTWSQPNLENGSSLKPPDISAVINYLAAFYHGLPVKELPLPKLRFTKWDDECKKRVGNVHTNPTYIGLNTSTTCIRIRTRPSKDNIFLRQLNLDDLLDTAIEILPEDAYALLLLVNHDLYESHEDEFVCGRAYGGSRVAVVSTARYHPALDAVQGIDRDHPWPASHCTSYIQNLCSTPTSPSKSKIPNSSPTSPPPQTHAPLIAALKSHKSHPPPSTPSALQALWLTRICRTSSHELGHCFGIDHCVYYACSMQGTSSLAEDTRQPPYLCPVDLAKVLRATGVTAEERYGALREFCVEDGYEGMPFWGAFGAWVEGRLRELGG